MRAGGSPTRPDAPPDAQKADGRRDQAVDYRHLVRLSDDTGILEHALGPVPRRECGYCLDDNARALVVVSRATDPSPVVSDLAGRYLAFVAHAQHTDGRCHNRLGYDRRWEDQPGLGDWWGRALWGLGVAAACHPEPWLREAALRGFELSAGQRSPHRRSMAFAALGAAEVVRAHPGSAPAHGLLAAVAEQAGQPRDNPDWPWPEDRLTYANAVLPEAMIATGRALGDTRLKDNGLRLLRWLLGVETRSGRLSVTPVAGRSAPSGGPGFDQQPIEVAGLAEACALAYEMTGDPVWAGGVGLARSWFLGDNDAGVAMFDPLTGGGYDGLEPTGRNLNQGAESTLALLSTLQHSRRLESGRS